MSEQLVRCEIREGVATVTLDNPPLNVVTLRMTRQLDAMLDALAADGEVRVLVLSGAGSRAFCAGSDIKEFREMMQPGAVLEKKLVFENATYSKLDDFPKPTLAALAGLAFGGGLELAVCCDLIVAEAQIQICLPEIKLGVFPGSGGTVRVTRRIGEGRAKEMMFLGEPIDAATALAWGLVNRVVPEATALEAAQKIATVLAALPNQALQMCKRAIDLSFDTTEDEAIRQTLALSDRAFSTADCREGVRAFFAKEPAQFAHR